MSSQIIMISWDIFSYIISFSAFFYSLDVFSVSQAGFDSWWRPKIFNSALLKKKKGENTSNDIFALSRFILYSLVT